MYVALLQGLCVLRVTLYYSVAVLLLQSKWNGRLPPESAEHELPTAPVTKADSELVKQVAILPCPSFPQRP